MFRYRQIVCNALLLMCLSSRAAFAIEMTGLWPSPAEVIALPHFCYGQFLKEKYTAPEFNIPQSCGVGMNHYCPALVVLNRANKSYADRMNRRGYLESAERQTVYTLEAMKKSPSCPIRPHVENTYRQIQMQIKLMH